MDAVTQAIIRLFESERFYAEIILSMKRIISKNVPIAGVCIKDSIELHLNPETFPGFPIEQRVAILKHECEHILRDHIGRSKKIAPDVYGKPKDAVDGLLNQMRHMSLNVAADLAINGGLLNLPEQAVFPEKFNFPKGETFEWYHQQLKDGKDKNKQKGKAKGEGEPEDGDGSGGFEFDDHAIWGESEGQEEVIKEKIRQAINQAAERTRAAGRMTGNDELLVNELNKNLVNWKAQMRRFVARSMETIVEASKKKRNRRYGIMFPGEVKLETLNIGVAIDTSGSVSDEALKQFLAEVHNISKYARVFMVQADTEVKSAHLYDPKKKYKIAGRGGTAYQPVFDYFNDGHDEKIDGLIYFGDMDCFDKEEIKKPKYPVLWGIVGKQPPPVSFGSKIYIE